VVPKFDRLARSVPDARAIGDELAAHGVALSFGGQVHDPTDGQEMFSNVLATFAEFEVDLLRMRVSGATVRYRRSMLLRMIVRRSSAGPGSL
jgi:DNA invertase Pin-like site-specific DNA recombinase